MSLRRGLSYAEALIWKYVYHHIHHPDTGFCGLLFHYVRKPRKYQSLGNSRTVLVYSWIGNVDFQRHEGWSRYAEHVDSRKRVDDDHAVRAWHISLCVGSRHAFRPKARFPSIRVLCIIGGYHYKNHHSGNLQDNSFQQTSLAGKGRHPFRRILRILPA